MSEAAGVTIEHIAKSHIHKKSGVARITAQGGDRPGLINRAGRWTLA